MKVAAAPVSKVVSLLGTKIEIRSGGNVSIDIGRYPPPTKQTAMQHYLEHSGWDPTEGYYFGNENGSPASRDAMMARIVGLQSSQSVRRKCDTPGAPDHRARGGSPRSS